MTTKPRKILRSEVKAKNSRIGTATRPPKQVVSPQVKPDEHNETKRAAVVRRLRRLGKDRQWLSEVTGYAPLTVRDALIEGSSAKKMSERMYAEFDRAISAAEIADAAATPSPGDILEEFSAEERKAIGEFAAKEGSPSAQAWIVSKVRALVAMLRQA